MALPQNKNAVMGSVFKLLCNLKKEKTERGKILEKSAEI